MKAAFFRCSNVTSHAVDTPDLQSVTDMSKAFKEAKSFNGYIGDWDVSTVTICPKCFMESPNLINR